MSDATSSPKSRHINPVSSLIHRLISYVLLTLLTLNGVFHFFYSLISLPIKLISPTLFRKLCSFWLYYTVPGFLCIPFSWRNTKLYSNNLQRFRDCQDQDLLILGNHQGRIDWLIGMFYAWTYGQRVTFITEAFIMFLPFIGWHRYIVEDMFVFRSFKRDKERLLKNIKGFHNSKVSRWVFLCPEGHIADFNDMDEKYINQCREFCKTEGFEPFEMVLTPRYKGMQCFNQIVTKGEPDKKAVHMSITVSYVQNGIKLVQPLKSKNRVTPDLWNIVQGGLECHVHSHALELSNDPKEIKHQLLTDYSLKDKLLKQFYLKGKFPDAYPDKSIEESPENWKPKLDKEIPFETEDPENESKINYFQNVPVKHVFMNLSFFAQLFLWWKIVNYFQLGYIVRPSIKILFLLVSLGHFIGEKIANGQSRESIPFEGLIKALVYKYNGIGKKKKKSKATKTE